jgi:mannose-6-phosphate isomerase-like protein (cupin superfamily)
MSKCGVGFTGAVVLLLSSHSSAQIASATDVTQAEYLAVKNAPEGGVDRQVKVVDIGKSNVAVGILHRDALERISGPARGIVHSLVTEVYYIHSGGGTLMTGGTMSERRDIPADDSIVTTIVGESFRAVSIGGRSRYVSVGDIVVIPAGVFHGWTEIEDHVTYLSVRPDPDKVLPAGWVNPVIR